MKKWLLIISVILCSNKNGFSQVEHDSFFKYSYLVLATNTPFKAADLNKGHTLQAEAGTCFFVRIKAKLFLVTTSHLIDQIDGFNQVRLPETFSNLEFRYYDDSTKNYEFFNIKLDPKLKEKPVYSFMDHPDVAIIEIRNLPKNAIVNSVEKLIYSDEKKGKKPGGAFFWGFQQEEQKSTSLTSANPVTNIMCLESNLYNGVIANESHYNPFYTNIDAINYVLSPKTNAGASGAPVFFFTSVIKNNKKVESTQFAGVQFGIDYDYNCTYIVKAAEVIKMIKSQIKD